MGGLSKYISDLFVCLGTEKRKLPKLFLLFCLASLLDLVGIGLVGGYISLLTKPETIESHVLHEWVIQTGVVHTTPGVVLGIGLVLIAIFVLKTVLAIALNWLIVRFANTQLVRLRKSTMGAFQALPYEKIVTRSSSEYIQSVQSYVNQFTGSLILLLRMISEGVVAIAILLFLATQNLVALGVMTVFGVLMFVSYDKSFRKRVMNAGRDINLANQRVIRGIQEAFSGLKEIRVLGRNNYFLDSVVQNSKIVAKSQTFTAVVGMSPRYLVEVAIVLFVVVLVAIVFIQTESLESSYALIGMFGVASLRLGPSITMITSNVVVLRNNRHGVNFLAGDLESYVAESSESDLFSRSGSRFDFSTFEMVNVDFFYEKSVKPALTNVSLRIQSGESIGIVGPSGSGKTTLIDVLLGLLEPQTGVLLFNDQPLGDGLQQWRSKVAYLPQEVFLLDDSLQANIALGIPESELDDALLWTCLDQARLLDVVAGLPNGPSTIIGERGVRLSGGQRQRVALARALYHQREVLILDEATSALDSNIEREIVEEIK